MANREELAIIRNARAGQAAAQLELGRLYLFGSAGLPQSLPTALHWLERAARQDCSPAWQLIGNHIPLELAQRNPAAVAQWYERAYDDGSVHAGLVFAQLMLNPAAAIDQQYPKAVRALEDAARAGFPHAQWLLSQQGKTVAGPPPARPGARLPAAAASPVFAPARAPGATTRGTVRIPGQGTAGHPTGQGASAAQYAQLDTQLDTQFDTLWVARQWDAYLALALPRARAFVGERSAQGEMRRFAPDEITLLSRCARVLDPALEGVDGPGPMDAGALARCLAPGEPGVFWELAAAEHDRHAQLALGLRCARMRVDGRRMTNGARARGPSAYGVNEQGAGAYIAGGPVADAQVVDAHVADAQVANAQVANAHVANAQVANAHVADAQVANAHVADAHVANAQVANFKKAIRWLTLAGEQGLAEAWYALSRIYIKPEFSQRNVADAQRYLEHAAEMGYRDAQLECGNSAWRARRENENNDVRAVYWLQKAAAQGSPDAAGLLHKIAPRLAGAPYVETGRLLASHAGALAAHPFLAARIELAALFNLTRAEALLLDVGAADQGHCLVIDIRASYGRSKRRLVMVESPHEREALDRIALLFAQVDCGPVGPEGNYRQRLYRLRTVLNLGRPRSDDDDRAEIGLAA